MQARKEIAEILVREDNFLIASHLDPDGDAIGSMFALGHILKRLGKRFGLYSKQGLPERFAWLNPPAAILQSPEQNWPEWLIALDCGNEQRLGPDLAQRLATMQVINIDHHLGNPHFGQLNWVETQKSSVGEMMACIALDLGLELNHKLGESLYLALVTDTGSFTYSNTQGSTLQIAAQIVASGLNLDSFNARMQRQWSLRKIQAHGMAMQKAGLYLQGKAGVITADSEIQRRFQATSEDFEGLVNYMRQIRGVIVAVSLLQEQENIKFSLRSWGEVDVSAVAIQLGGGGHRNAAGGKLPLSLKQALARILQVLDQTLNTQTEQSITAEGGC